MIAVRATGIAGSAFLLVIGLGVHTSSAQENGGPPAYETPPVLKASDFLEPGLLKGPNHEVEEKVVSDAVFNTYVIDSLYGPYPTQGSSLVAIRVREIDAIAQLDQVDKAAVAAGAILASVVDMGKGVLNVVTNPVGTVTGLGDGAKRLFLRIGRSVTRTSEEMQADKNDQGQEKSTGAKIADTSGDVVKDLVGVNTAMRKWAQKLGVDPYTRNALLHQKLQTVATYDAGGRFSTRLIPGGTVVLALGAASTVSSLVWEKDPDEIVTLNEARLTAMGVKPEDSRAFRLNRQYGLARKTLLIASLNALPGVPGRAEYVARAADVEDEAGAQYYVDSAVLLDLFNRKQAPIESIVPDLPGACFAAKGGRFVCGFPLDYVVWTEGVATYMDLLAKRAEADFPKATRELWLTGRVSPRMAQELETHGWKLHENGLAAAQKAFEQKAVAQQ